MCGVDGGDEGDGDVEMDATTAVVLASEGEMLTATSSTSKASRKKIDRASSKLE